MADVGQAIYSRLSGNAAVSALAATRIKPYTPVDPLTRPYITYHLISMVQRPHAMGSTPALVTDRYQIDVWADSYASMVELDDAVYAALSRWRGSTAGVEIVDSLHVDRRELYEADTQLFRRSNDYEISWREA
jgi:hypothetical protein